MHHKDPFLKKRIFVGFNSAGSAGIYAFTRVLKRRGFQIDFYGINKTAFEVPVDFLLKFSSNKLISFFQRISCFFRLLFKHDIWHFNYMEVFFFYPLNLLILKMFGKKIICTFRGSEVRSNLDFLPKELFRKSKKPWPKYYQRISQNQSKWAIFKKRIRMNLFCYLADKVVLTGPFLVSSVSRFDTIIPYARDIKQINKNLIKTNKKITVLHVPTEPDVKGTAEIEKIFKKLAKKYSPRGGAGPNINFKIILEALPREQLLKEMSQADIIVDQIIVGWYGGQAVEAMAMGKTVLAFINPVYLHFVNFAQDLPIYNTNPWSLKKDLEFLINSPKECQRIGQDGIKFVRKYHEASKIAAKYLEIYREMI